MIRNNVKKCPVCGSHNLQFVYYAPPVSAAPEFWEYDEDGYMPIIWLKRIECIKCGATVPQLVLTVDQAIEYWNAINETTGSRYTLQRVKEESFTASEVSEAIFNESARKDNSEQRDIQ